jgi:signal transduction histidine kinase
LKRFTASAIGSWLRKKRSLRFKIFLAILCGTLVCLLISAMVADGISRWRIREFMHGNGGQDGWGGSGGSGDSQVDEGPSYVDAAIFFAGFIGLILAFFLSYWLASRLSRPLAELTSATHDIAAGDYGKQVEAGSTTEIAELGEAFNSLSRSLERNETLRRNMVADVAHELRTPLVTLRGLIEAIQDGVVEPDSATIDSLLEDALLLGRLVDDLQQLALAEAGKLELDLAEADAAEIVRGVAARFETEASSQKIQLALDLPADLPLIQADEARISQVLNNLVRNSLMHVEEGGSITLRVRAAGAAVTFSVEDTGQGIDAEELPYIFERFYRTDRSRARATGGAGLGLSIARGLVEAHGGRIWAESTKGKGTAVHFTI